MDNKNIVIFVLFRKFFKISKFSKTFQGFEIILLRFCNKNFTTPVRHCHTADSCNTALLRYFSQSIKSRDSFRAESPSHTEQPTPLANMRYRYNFPHLS